MFLEEISKGDFDARQLLQQDRAKKLGFPTKKTEEFKYLSLKDLEREEFHSLGEYKISCLSESVEIMSLADAEEKYGLVVTNRLEKSSSHKESYFSLLNRGYAKDRFCIFIKDAKDVVEIREEISGNNAAIMPQIYYFMSKGVFATIHHHISISGKGNMVNRVVDVAVEKEANISFYETTEIENDNKVFFHTTSTVKEGATFTHRSGSKGCSLFRNEVKSYLLEKDATAVLEGFWNGSHEQSIHHLAHCSHLAEETNSRQHYQGVVNDSARASFEGQIYVDKVAQKTDSYQLSKHLLIGDKARGFSKPNLEVFADDVVASHGATVSALNEEELFYLTSRGIGKDAAATLLMRGFLSFFIEKMEKEKLKEYFLRLVR